MVTQAVRSVPQKTTQQDKLGEIDRKRGEYIRAQPPTETKHDDKAGQIDPRNTAANEERPMKAFLTEQRPSVRTQRKCHGVHQG